MPKIKKLTADEVIQQIAEILPENDGEFIEDIANRVLGRKVKYIGDSLFKYDD
jgi:hypothetical protein